MFEENEDAIQVFQYVKAQAIYAGMDGIPVDLDFKALQFTMDMLGIENKADCFNKVLTAWRHSLEIERIKRENKEAK